MEKSLSFENFKNNFISVAISRKAFCLDLVLATNHITCWPEKTDWWGSGISIHNNNTPS